MWWLEVRWQMCWLLFFARATCQANRVLLGALLPFITRDLGISAAGAGRALAAFGAGYACTQIVGGVAGDRLGAKPPILLALVGLSLGSWVAPAALGDYGLNAFAAVYFAMGFCEGPSYPSTGSALARWIPEHERSEALSIADTGSSVGSMVAFSLAPVVALYAGWRRAFTLCAYWSAAVALAWAAWAASGPASCARLPAEERAYLREHGLGVGEEGKGASEKGLSRFPAFPRRLFRARSVWATVYAHAAFNFGRYFVYNSLVGFYVDELGTSPVVAGQHVLLGQIADTVGKFA